MTAEARRIARRARRLGYSSVTLGNATEEHWAALRVLLGCEDADDATLAAVVDVMLTFEQDPNWMEV